ncbi:ABC-three component system protein [Facklamia sp. P12950]|uniref:ABC-three component system protein n=1 Tax=Facklamia sp. P12950 TaxID=3421951 RepID=UPI003D16AF18
MNSVKLEKDILEVINNLSSIDLSDIPVDLTLDAIEIKKKIYPGNSMLIFDINTKVTSFYNTVRNIFSNLEGEGIIIFEKIASQVKLFYLSLEEENINQSQIYEEVTDWIQISSGGSSNRLACQIIAAFFVQNCEVFNEISQ